MLQECEMFMIFKTNPAWFVWITSN